MRSHLEFRSAELIRTEEPDAPAGEAIAKLLATHLPAQGYAIKAVFAEDWGWCVQIVHKPFPLWIGCGHYQEYPDGVLCFIEPSKPFVRRWLTRISTGDIVDKLAAAIESIVTESGKATALKWWSEDETG